MKRFLKIAGMAIAVLVGLVILASIVGFAATNGDYQVQKTIDQDPSLPRIEAGGVVFHGQTFGDPGNPPLIVVHGGPGADYQALLALNALADHYYVVFYDQRGTGLSPRVDPTQLTFDTYLADLDAIVEQYRNGGQVNLIGHSFGGQLVAAYASQHPDKVAKVILAEPGPLSEEMSAKGPVRTATLESVLPGVVATLQSLHIDGPDAQAQADYVIGQMMLRANPGYWCQAQAPAGSDGWRWGGDANLAVTRSLFNANGHQIRLVEGADRLRDKVLFLATSCDHVIGEDFQREQMQYFPNAQMVVIQDAGHEMFLDQPEQTIAAIRTYLAE